MQIQRSSSPVPKPVLLRAPQPPPGADPEGSEGEWLGSALTVAGGVVALTGGLTGHPLMVAGGSMLTATGSSLEAWRAQSRGSLETGAAVSLAAGFALTLVGVGLLCSPSTGSAQGPLPQLMEQLGIQP